MVAIALMLAISTGAYAQNDAQKGQTKPNLPKAFAKFVDEYQDENGTEFLVTDVDIQTVVKAVVYAFSKAEITHIWTDVQANKTVVYGEVPRTAWAGGSKIKVTILKNDASKTWAGFYYRTEAMGFATAHAKMGGIFNDFNEQVNAFLAKSN
jgi:hypothetical protein